MQEDLFENTILLLEHYIREEVDAYVKRILPELLKRVVREVKCNGENNI